MFLAIGHVSVTAHSCFVISACSAALMAGPNLAKQTGSRSSQKTYSNAKGTIETCLHLAAKMA